MKARFLVILDALRASFWFVPGAMLVGAALLFIATRELDVRFDTGSGHGTLTWTYTGDADGARGLLSTIASSVITVAGVSFSITIAALTLASSQLGPRLLRTFLRDRGNQIVLGTLVATFTYSLLVLRIVRGEEGGAVVPQISITTSAALAVASVAVWIYFIHHVATVMQANHAVAAVGEELDDGIGTLFPEAIGRAPEQHALRELPEPSAPVRACRTGYLQVIDDETLLESLCERDAVLRLDVRPGHFLFAGAAIGSVWPAGRAGADLDEAIASAMGVGVERTPVQDVGFSIDQLVEIAVRALSPGVNDPFTAVACVDRLGAAIHRLVDRSMPARQRLDEDGTLRVLATPVHFGDLVERALDPLRDAARAQPMVTLRLLDVLEPSLVRARADRRGPLLHQVEQILRGSRALADASARVRVCERYRSILAAGSTSNGSLRRPRAMAPGPLSRLANNPRQRPPSALDERGSPRPRPPSRPRLRCSILSRRVPPSTPASAPPSVPRA